MYCSLDLYCTVLYNIHVKWGSVNRNSRNYSSVDLSNQCYMFVPSLCQQCALFHKSISEEQLFLLDCQHLRLQYHKKVEPSSCFTCTSKTWCLPLEELLCYWEKLFECLSSSQYQKIMIFAVDWTMIYKGVPEFTCRLMACHPNDYSLWIVINEGLCQWTLL